MTQSRAPLIIAIVLLLLPVLYLGSYLALVRPTPTQSPFDDDVRSFSVSLKAQFEENNYRFASSVLSKFFWPLEQIDRKVRPGKWAWEPLIVPDRLGTSRANRRRGFDRSP